jgi:DNA processing protein
MDYKNEVLHTIALSLVPGIGAVKARALINHFNGAEWVFKQKIKALLQVPDIGEITAKSILQSQTLDVAKKEMDFIEKNNIIPILFTQHNFPERLSLCSDAPLVLFTKGNPSFNTDKVISIVGTRNATAYGRAFCNDLIAGIANQKPLVVSGLAFGIDIASHKAAIQHNLPTVACLAHSLDFLYPPAHANVAKDIQFSGGLVSEFLSGTKPERELFPTRNRIIAGLADCTIVVETDKKGGSIITAYAASSYGREVFAVPGRTSDIHSAGCNDLIRKNIAAILTSPEDLIDYMNWNAPATTTNKQLSLFEEISPFEKLICETISEHGQIGIDELCGAIQKPMALVSSGLLELELKSIVMALPGKNYMLAPTQSTRRR